MGWETGAGVRSSRQFASRPLVDPRESRTVGFGLFVFRNRIKIVLVRIQIVEKLQATEVEDGSERLPALRQVSRIRCQARGY